MGTRRWQVVWSPSAARALDEAVEYVARESPAGAVKLLSTALTTAGRLARFAQRGRIVPELGHPQVRELFVYGYRLVYEVEASRVSIIAFLHGARDFNAFWRRDGKT